MSTLLGAIAGGVLGLGQTALNSEIARRQSEADRAANYRYGEMAANNADKRTRLLYQDFYSPQALLTQYREAGLSPSMMFGGTPGQGGMSGAQGSGASGPQTPFVPPSIVESALAMAQVDKLKAETRKANAEAATEEGTNDRGAAEISKIVQETATSMSQQGYNEAATILTNQEATLKKIETDLQNQTFWTDVALREQTLKQLEEQTKQVTEQTRSIRKQADFDEKMFEEKCNQFRAQTGVLWKDVLLKQSNITLNEHQQKLFDKEVEHIAYQMQLDYWYSLKANAEFDWKKQTELAELNLKKLGYAIQIDQQDINMWQTKVNALTQLTSAGMHAIGLGAFKGK